MLHNYIQFHSPDAQIRKIMEINDNIWGFQNPMIT